MSKLNNRYEFVLLFDVENGNPNGDPDAGNMPRIDAETSLGIMTDVCLKRKVRNFVEMAKEGEAGFDLYVKEKAILNKQNERGHKAVELKKKGKPTTEEAKDWMCANFFDVRTFGAVMSTGDFSCGQVRGPVQCNFSRSIEPVTPVELTITRMAVTTEKEAESQKGDNRTMGRKYIIPYGLYRMEGYISAHLANKTGFSEDDLELLFSSLTNMFDHDHSAARGKMSARKLIVFKHDSKLGNAPAHKLFDLIKIERAEGSQGPARQYTDYAVEIDNSALPAGVELTDRI
jgi:CRISPR-associated protein Csd2